MDTPRTASDLDRGQAILLAKICGAGQRLSFGPDDDVALEDAVAVLHGISDDPVLLGLALGAALAQLEEQPQWGPALVELLRAAGADERVAARNLVWQRARPTFSRP